ncbi:MAG: CHAT domain-containing protein [Deltaproteobacteria bacterium]|nr:CHAT domain-containing protein [Deltaproteobacteria bacterium]
MKARCLVWIASGALAAAFATARCAHEKAAVSTDKDSRKNAGGLLAEVDETVCAGLAPEEPTIRRDVPNDAAAIKTAVAAAWDALGGFSNPNLYRGNPREAAAWAAGALKAATKTGDPAILFEAELATAAVLLSAGLPLRAKEHLEKAIESQPTDRLETLNFKRSGLLDGVFVSAFATQDGGYAVGYANEIERRQAKFLPLNTLDGYFSKGAAKLPPPEAAPVVREYVTWLGTSQVVFSHLAQFAREAGSSEHVKKMAQVIPGVMNKNRSVLDKAGDSVGLAVMDAIRARLLYRGGYREEAEQALTDAEKRFGAAGDVRGVGLCRIVRAEGMIASHAGLEALNVPSSSRSTTESAGRTLGYQLQSYWKRPEQELVRAIENEAAGAEREAGQSSDSISGAAALVRGLLALRLAQPDQALLRFAEARKSFCRAGGGQNAAAALLGAVVTSAVHGRPNESELFVRAHAKWHSASGQLGRAVGAGRVLNNVGNELYSHHREMSRALFAFELAGRYLQGANVPFTEAHHFESVIRVYRELGLSHAASNLARTALAAIEKGEQDLQKEPPTDVFDGKPKGPSPVTQVRSLQANIYQDLLGEMLLDTTHEEEFRNTLDEFIKKARDGIKETVAIMEGFHQHIKIMREIVLKDEKGLDHALKFAQENKDGSIEGLVYLARSQFDKAVAVGEREIAEVEKQQRDDSKQGPHVRLLYETQLAARLSSLVTSAIRAKQADKARKALERWVSMAPSWQERLLRPWEVDVWRGQIAEIEEKKKEALGHFLDAISRVKEYQLSLPGEMQRVGISRNLREPVAGILVLMLGEKPGGHAARGDIETAFAALEESRGQVLSALLGQSASQKGGTLGPEDRAQADHFKARIAAVRSRMNALDPGEKDHEARVQSLQREAQAIYSDFTRWRDQVLTKHPELAMREGTVRPATLGEAQALAGRLGATLLSYFVTRDRTYIFAIDEKDVRVAAAEVKRDDVERLAGKILDPLMDPNDASFRRSAAQELHRRLVKPVEDVVSRHDLVYVVADGALLNLPFQILHDGNAYLLDKVAVAYAPSVTVLGQLADRAAKATGRGDAGRLVAVGDPYLGKDGKVEPSRFRGGAESALGQIPEAKAEVEALAGIWGGSSAVTLIDERAKESAVKEAATRAGIIHIAAHGLFNYADPDRSGVVLAQVPDGDEDGYLEAHEVAQMNLGARLAVMSTCVSGKGHTYQGEGLIGLARAFFAAGVPSFVGSNWYVDSAATTALMTEFHKALKAGKPVPHALRDAALALRKLKPPPGQDYTEPYFWAAFSAMGR